MKKLKRSLQLNKSIICIALAVVFFISLFTCVNFALADTMTIPCTDCDGDGYVTEVTSSACTSQYCVNGYSTFYECTNCGGSGSYIEIVTQQGLTFYVLYGCSDCGGSGSSSAMSSSDLNYAKITVGRGYLDCPDCVGGLVYSSVNVLCETCDGSGEVEIYVEPSPSPTVEPTETPTVTAEPTETPTATATPTTAPTDTSDFEIDTNWLIVGGMIFLLFLALFLMIFKKR